MKTTKKVPVEPLTVTDLKTWLDGYCSAQPGKWTPTAAQWKLIKSKIFALEESQAVTYAAQPFPIQPQYETNYGGHPSSMMGGDTGGMSSGIDRSVVGLTNTPGIIMADGKMKTPDGGTVGGKSDFG